MKIYNLFPLLAGRFSDWQPHLQRSADLGFDWVFVNAIQYAGFSGSLYSISDYFRWHSLVVDESDKSDPFQQSRNMMNLGHELGLQFMSDLIINHCAFDSPLVKQHPDWFQWENGQIVHPHCYDNGEKVVWGDLVKFRYDDSAAVAQLIPFWLRVIEFLFEQGFRGFRCDAAYQVPAAVWQELIATARERFTGITFLAESLGCSPGETRALAEAGFDYVFNSSKWWNFCDEWLLEQYQQTQGVVNSVSFAESHDTPRLAAELDGNVAGLKQRYLFSALFSAGVLMPMGYEYGCRNSLNVVSTRPSDWLPSSVDLTDFIRETNRVKSVFATFQRDVPTRMLPSGNDSILLMVKEDSESREVSLMILNQDIHNHQPFYCDDLYALVSTNGAWVDVSPENRLDFIATPFEYRLRPGQGIVLVAGGSSDSL